MVHIPSRSRSTLVVGYFLSWYRCFFWIQSRRVEQKMSETFSVRKTFLPFDIDDISPSVTTIWIYAFSHAISSWRKPVLCGIFVKWSFFYLSLCLLKKFYGCLFSFVFILSLVHVGLSLLQYWISAQICRFFYYRFHKILIIEYLYTSFKMYPRRCFQITSTINLRWYNFLSSVSSSFFRM